MNEYKLRRNLYISAALVYILTSSIAIISAWVKGLTPVLYLGYTVSVYVGLQKVTAAIYFAGVITIATTLFIFLLKTKLRILRRIVYYITLVFLIGLGWFPVQFNRPDCLASKGHEFFSDAFFVSVIVSLILMFIFDRRVFSRIYAILGIVFSIGYVVCYALRFGPFVDTILIWESVFIYFYMIEYLFLLLDKSTDIGKKQQ